MGIVTNLNLIYTISFMDLLAIGLTMPIFTSHLKEIGFSHLTIGILMSFYSGMQVITGPIIGGWSDVKDRKTVLVIVIIICCISYFLLGVSTYLVNIFILRALIGTFKHIQSLCKAVITDLLPENERLGAFGRSAALGSLGFIIGPLIGGHIAEFENGFAHVCTLTAVLFFLNLCLVLFLSLPERTKIKPVSYNFTEKLRKTIFVLMEINWSKYWSIFLIRFLFGLSISIFFSVNSFYLRNYFNLSQKAVGYVISYFSTISMIAAFFLQPLKNIFHNNNIDRQLFNFFTILTICFFLLYISPNILVFLLILIPLSICCSILRITSLELMLNQAESKNRGSLSGASNSIMSIARFVTPIISGIIADLFDEYVAILLAALPAFIATVICYVVMRRDKLKSD